MPTYLKQLTMDDDFVGLVCSNCFHTFARESSWARDNEGARVGCPNCGVTGVMPRG